MSEQRSTKKISRADFLKLVAAVGVTAAGAVVLDSTAPWLNYGKAVEQAARPLEKASSAPAQAQELVRYATMAANGHNTQPWKFAVTASGLRIQPDAARRLAVVDPSDRELWISLGCALENMLIAARAAGYAPEVTYPDAENFIDVTMNTATPQGSPLFDAIPLRQNTRSEYDGQPLKSAHLDAIKALTLEPGVALRFAENPADLSVMLDYVNQGNLAQYADTNFVDELIFWLRFNKKEAMASNDGLFSRCSGNMEVSRWLGQMFVSGTKPQQQADADAKKLQSSSGAVVIASETDDRSAWVRTGQVYERLTLLMTSLDVKSALLNQPIEVAAVRPQFQSAIGLGAASPQLLVRFGYAEALPRSLRRPVDQVLS